MRRAVFLDRDGVINRAVVRDRKPYPPQTLGEVEILDEEEVAGWLSWTIPDAAGPSSQAICRALRP